MVRVTGHVLCELFRSLKGFIPLVLNANLMFLASFPNSGNLASNASTACHWRDVAAFHHPSYVEVMHART
jgi:hypothetical protein